METTIVYGVDIWVIVGAILGLCRDNGKENGNYCTIMGCIGFRISGLGFRRNGKENGNFGFGV